MDESEILSVKDLTRLNDEKREEILLSYESLGADGSGQHQLVLGEYYLWQYETGIDCDQNSRLATRWLIRASRRGDEVATNLLAECRDKNIGMTEENAQDVSWCLETSRLEKVARQAARCLFRALNPLNSGELSRDDYLNSIAHVSENKVEKKLLERAARKSGAVVSEEAFVEKLMNRLKGHSNMTLTTLFQSDVDIQEYQNASLFTKLRKYPGKTLALVLDQTVETVGKQGMFWLRSLIPVNQIHMLIFFFVYSALSLRLVVWFLPLALAYLSYVSMLLCTIQMLHSKQKLNDVTTVARLLRRYSLDMDSETARSSYSWGALTPYWGYFGSLIVFVGSLGVADKAWIPCPEMALLSLLSAVVAFGALSDRYDRLVAAAILLDILSSLPDIFRNLPHVPLLTSCVNFFLGSGYSIEIFPGFFLNLGLPSLAYTIMPGVFVAMAIQRSWRGTYQILIPHLVCFFWWQVALLLYVNSTWLGMLRASAGWVALLFLLALLPLFLLLLTAFAIVWFLRWFTLDNLLKMFTTILLIFLTALFGMWAGSGFRIRRFSLEEKSTSAKIVLVIVALASSLPFFYFLAPQEYGLGTGEYVTWDQYKDLCSYHQWDRTNMADSMVLCSRFKHLMAEWTGPVKKIVVKETQNPVERFVSYLPWSLSDWLKCTYGTRYPDNCTLLSDNRERTICEISTRQNRHCHLTELNRYTFEIWVKMAVDIDRVHDVRVEASHHFKDALMKIREDDVIYFRALMAENLGNVWPELKLYYLKCVSCIQPVAYGNKKFLTDSFSAVYELKHAFAQMWNFFLAPVLEFKFEERS